MCLIVDKTKQIIFQPPESHLLLAAYYLWLQANQPESDGTEFWYKAVEQCNYAILYKVVIVEDYVRSPLIYDYIWKNGWNYSYNDPLNKDAGLYLFLNYEDAQFAVNTLATKTLAMREGETGLAAFAIMPCHCYKEDCIAIGTVSSSYWTDGKYIPEAAVFDRVFVPNLPEIKKQNGHSQRMQNR